MAFTIKFIGSILNKLLLGLLETGERWLETEDALDKSDALVVLWLRLFPRSLFIFGAPGGEKYIYFQF